MKFLPYFSYLKDFDITWFNPYGGCFSSHLIDNIEQDYL